MWAILELEPYIRLLLKIANQIVFLVLLVRFIHRKLHGATSWNSLWKSLTVVCCALLANYYAWPLFLRVTHFLVSHHNHWTIGILLMGVGWISNRWLTTNMDQTTVPIQQSQQRLPEQREPTKYHSQGDVLERIYSKSFPEIGHIDRENFDRTVTIPKSIQSRSQDSASEKIDCKNNRETVVENIDLAEVMSQGTQTNILSPTEVKQSIETPEREITFFMPQYRVIERSEQLLPNISNDPSLTKISTRSGRAYLRT